MSFIRTHDVYLLSEVVGVISTHTLCNSHHSLYIFHCCTHNTRACLWWKAIAGNSIHSPVYDSQLSYDLLPSVTRWIVNERVCNLYSRLHHANVEIR